MKLIEHLVVDLCEAGLDPLRARAAANELYVVTPAPVEAGPATFKSIQSELEATEHELDELNRYRKALTAVRDKWAMSNSTNGHAPPEKEGAHGEEN